MEAYWLINFVLDLMLLVLAHRSMRRIRWLRTLSAAAAGAFVACLAAYFPYFPPFLPLSAGLMVMCLLNSGGRQWLPSLIRTLFCALCLGGMGTLLRQATGRWTSGALGLLLLLGPICLLFFLDGQVRKSPCLHVQLCLCARGQQVHLEALVDTGNCLREPLSHLPVLVAEEALLAPLLPSDYGHTPLPRGFRMVQYGGVGGSGQMLCFLPDEIRSLRQGKWKRAPDMWVALYPGKLPGRARALAPGETGM